MVGKLAWDQTGQKKYETGTDRGVLFPFGDTEYNPGVAWSGLRLVTEAPDGAEETALYADNIKYLSLLSAENFKGSIGAYTYPDEFGILDGSVELGKGVTVGQQPRGLFGFSYRTLIGNDVKGTDYGYKIHLVYGAKVSPSQRENTSVNDTPAGVELSWDFTTTPIDIPGAKPSAHLIIDSTKVTADQLTQIEDALYGSADTEPHLLMPQEVVDIVKAAA